MLVDDGSTSYALPPRLDLRNHSPTGFQSGYNGSGPSQLALALLADAFGDDELAQDLYQEVKFKLVSRLPADGWELTSEDLQNSLDKIRADRGRNKS